jgi:CubicO group peptidase (beta-lactamase class C family)
MPVTVTPVPLENSIMAFGTAGSPGNPVTAETPFLIGSIPKSFTALAIKQLVEHGSVDLDAPATQWP